MENRRKHERLSIARDVELKKQSGELFTGKTENISFGGMRMNFETLPDVQVKEECESDIILQGGENRIIVRFDCQVVYSKNYSVGVQFIAINVEHYSDFMNLMIRNCTDPGKLLAELNKHPGLITKFNEQ